MTYHSGLRDPVNSPLLNQARHPQGVAFVHDLLTAPALPAEFAECDVLYADLPWRNGFSEFNRRAGVNDDRTYSEFLKTVARLLEDERRPVFLLTGKHALRQLPPPDFTRAVRMFQFSALAVVYNATPTHRSLRWTTATALLDQLGGLHRSVGDFCCGYGSSVRAFAEAGRRFVASDFNPRCVGYIAEHVQEWAGDR
jgi:hypothetical protein